MTSYDIVKSKIIATLMGRPTGTEIQPENHQDYALSLLDYVKQLELMGSSALIGHAESDTIPVEPLNSRVCYVSTIRRDSTKIFQFFKDENGKPITVTTDENESFFIVLIWNTQFWTISTTLMTQVDIFVPYQIRKTYSSYDEMWNDVTKPIGTDGRPIQIGELVAVVDLEDGSKNGTYSWEGTMWRFQSAYVTLAQNLGDNPNVALSQKGVTEAIFETKDLANKNLILLNKNVIYNFIDLYRDYRLVAGFVIDTGFYSTDDINFNSTIVIPCEENETYFLQGDFGNKWILSLDGNGNNIPSSIMALNDLDTIGNFYIPPSNAKFILKTIYYNTVGGRLGDIGNCRITKSLERKEIGDFNKIKSFYKILS